MSGATNFWIRWRVRVGYPVGIAAFLFARPQVKWLLGGVGIAFVGLLLRACAAGHLRKHQQLATSGPYAFTRNPLYLGTTLVYLGLGVAAGSLWAIGLVVPLMWVINVGVVAREERYLERKFGDAYRAYKARVRRWI